MKSLEILSWFIDALGGFSNGRILVEKEELEQIKQDLEVLEIIRKYLYYIDHTIKLKPISKSVYNFDYEKLKQWLETNKEGDYND